MLTGRDEHEMLTAQEAAELLRVDVRTVRRWIGEGTLPAYQIAGAHGRYLIAQKDLRSKLASATTTRAPA
jgi:excisionase family DNA binding protein